MSRIVVYREGEFWRFRGEDDNGELTDQSGRYEREFCIEFAHVCAGDREVVVED